MKKVSRLGVCKGPARVGWAGHVPVEWVGGSFEGDNPSPSVDGGGAGRTETLYIEVRQGDRPVDPLTWFTSDKG